MTSEDPFEALRKTFESTQKSLNELRKRASVSSEETSTSKIDIPILDELTASLQSVSQCCPHSKPGFTSEEQDTFNQLLKDIQKATINSYPEEIRKEIEARLKES